MNEIIHSIKLFIQLNVLIYLDWLIVIDSFEWMNMNGYYAFESLYWVVHPIRAIGFLFGSKNLLVLIDGL